MRADSTMIGTRRPAAHVADQLDTVAVGQAEVEHQQVGLARAGRRQAVAQRAGLVHLPALGFQRAAHEAADLRLVLDHDGDGLGMVKSHAEIAVDSGGSGRRRGAAASR